MKIYFMGICGTAMGNAALLMRSLGHTVLGADTGIYPPMSDVLREAGIEVLAGWDETRLANLAPDVVVIGNAQSRGHPEVEWLIETRRLPFTSLPALLHDQVLTKRYNIVVAGTHGKTTTTTLTAFLLKSQGIDPGYLIGGVPRDLPSGSQPGDAQHPFVIEGDEYDSAFFDKRSKFIHYAPRTLVLNNLEFDHADIFRDLPDVARTFSHVMRLVPSGGQILLNGDDANLVALPKAGWTKLWRVGVGQANDLRIGDFADNEQGSSFRLIWQNRPWTRIEWTLSGLFNARNAAMASLAAGLYLNPDDPTRLDLSCLARFQGVKRRQEILVASLRLIVMEDFGHHPTAVAETLDSLRRRHPDRELIACFEPRSNTSIRNLFQREYAVALGKADRALLGPVHRGDKMAASERLDVAAIAAEITQEGHSGESFPSSMALLDRLRTITRSSAGRPQLVCFFSNGAFDGIIATFAAEAG